MKNTTILKNTQKTAPRLNIAIVVILLLAALPAVIFGIIQALPPVLDTSVRNTTVDETPKRISAAERRAQRREAREAARKAETAQNDYTVNTLPAPEMGGFGGFAPDMNGFGGGFGPGMGGFAPDMNGFGGGFGPGMGGFAPDMNGFGGGFGPGMGGFGGFGDIGDFPGGRV